MTKRLVEIDDAQLESAREILGNKSIRATISEALALVIQIQAAQDSIEMFASGNVSDLADESVMKNAWRQ